MDDQAIQLADKIDRYLQGKMSEEEHKSFEYELAQDASLRNEVENTEIAKEAILYHGLSTEVSAIRQKMLQEEIDASIQPTLIANEVQDEKLKKLSWYQYSYRVAAAIVILFVAFIGIQTATVNPEGLYTSHIALNEVGEVTRGGSETESQSSLLDAYQQQNYASVTKIYENLEQPSYIESYFAAASYLHNNQTDDAILIYKQIIASARSQGNNEFMLQESSYKLAISYIRNGEYELAIPMLEHLDDQYPYYDHLISNSFLWKLKLLRFKEKLFN